MGDHLLSQEAAVNPIVATFPLEKVSHHHHATTTTTSEGGGSTDQTAHHPPRRRRTRKRKDAPSPPSLPSHIHFGGGMRICRKKVERFLTYLASACVIFFLCEVLKRWKTFREAPIATDAAVSFLMIFFIGDYLCFPEDPPPTTTTDADSEDDEHDDEFLSG